MGLFDSNVMSAREAERLRKRDALDASWASLGYRPATDWRGRRTGEYERPSGFRTAVETAVNAVGDYMFGLKKDFDFKRRGVGETPGGTYVSDPVTLGLALAGMAPIGKAVRGTKAARRAQQDMLRPGLRQAVERGVRRERSVKAAKAGEKVAGWTADAVKTTGSFVKTITKPVWWPTVEGGRLYNAFLGGMSPAHPNWARSLGWTGVALAGGTAWHSWSRSRENAANSAKVLEAEARRTAERDAYVNNVDMARATSDGTHLKNYMAEVLGRMSAEAEWLASRNPNATRTNDVARARIWHDLLMQAGSNYVPAVSGVLGTRAFEQLAEDQLRTELSSLAPDGVSVTPAQQENYVRNEWPRGRPFRTVLGPEYGVFDELLGTGGNAIPRSFTPVQEDKR